MAKKVSHYWVTCKDGLFSWQIEEKLGFFLYEIKINLVFSDNRAPELRYLKEKMQFPQKNSQVSLKHSSELHTSLCICHFTNLVEEEVIDVVGEKSSKLTLLGLARPHVHLYLLDESAQRSHMGGKKTVSTSAVKWGELTTEIFVDIIKTVKHRMASLR